MLLLPEYLNYLLTGQRVHEYTNASTTGLLDARARAWDWELIDRCGLAAPRVLSLVTMLEMDGILRREKGRLILGTW